MSNKKINDNELNSVSGGVSLPSDPLVNELGHFHMNCGGKLTNDGKIFRISECALCHESHYRINSFDHYAIKKSKTDEIYYRCDNGGALIRLSNRPAELDWSCNQF